MIIFISSFRIGNINQQLYSPLSDLNTPFATTSADFCRAEFSGFAWVSLDVIICCEVFSSNDEVVLRTSECMKRRLWSLCMLPTTTCLMLAKYQQNGQFYPFIIKTSDSSQHHWPAPRKQKVDVYMKQPNMCNQRWCVQAKIWCKYFLVTTGLIERNSSLAF